MAVISPELLASATPANVRARWPGIFDIDEAQAGGCPGFWRRYFPEGDPRLVLDTCRRRQAWGLFWDRICPAGAVRFVAASACGEGGRREGEAGNGSECSPGEVAVRVLEEVVKGRMASADPSFFLRDGPDLVLIWPLGTEGP